MNEIEKAERMQAWKAFLIPATLFVACLLNAAGIYIIYTGSSVGVVFLGLGFAVIVGGMFGFITFQNGHRAKGQWKTVSESVPEHLAQDNYAEEASDSISVETENHSARVPANSR